jgi:anti-sigma B factor antagonist
VLVTLITRGGPGACADLDWSLSGPDPSAFRKPRRMVFPRWGRPHPLCSTSAGGAGPVMTARDLSGGWAEQPFADDQPGDPTLRIPQRLLHLSVRHPDPGVCVVRVNGDLDLLTAPLLDACLREQLSHALPHLVVDLEGVTFLGASGLSSLLAARELAETTGVVLHLAGLVKKVVERSLTVSSLLPLFRCYPTLAHALAIDRARVDRIRVEPSHL